MRADGCADAQFATADGTVCVFEPASSQVLFTLRATHAPPRHGARTVATRAPRRRCSSAPPPARRFIGLCAQRFDSVWVSERFVEDLKRRSYA